MNKFIMIFAIVFSLFLAFKDCSSMVVGQSESNLRNTPKITSGNLPQFVVLTFDDAVNNELWEFLYKDLFKALTDPHTRCDIKATFFVSHNNTDYTKVNALHHAGHEIALHSFSHGGDRQDSEELVRSFQMGRWKLEIQQNIKNMVQHGHLPKDMVYGWRAPFLFTGGDESFSALNQSSILYDSSLTFYEKSWPYRMSNVAKSQNCLIKPCPSRSDYLLYEAPLSVWEGVDGHVCAMMDSCRFGSTKEEVFQTLMRNFASFRSEGVPMVMSLHGGALNNDKAVHFRQGLEEFVRHLLAIRDVHFVTMRQLVEFVHAPMNTFQYVRKARKTCSTFRAHEPCQPLKPACEFKNKQGGKSVYLNTCAKTCPSERSEIRFDYFGASCCEL